MGPLLRREGYTLYFPGSTESETVPYYYESENKGDSSSANIRPVINSPGKAGSEKTVSEPSVPAYDIYANETGRQLEKPSNAKGLKRVDTLSWAHPLRIWATIKLVFTYGITRDAIKHQPKGLDDVHARATVYESKVEYLWTTAQVCTAMLMSIAHGANDFSNAIGPFTTEYETWSSGVTSAETETPT